MAEATSGHLRVWESGSGPPSGPPPDPAAALFTAESMTGGRARSRAEPFSLQWFLDLEKARHTRHGRWIPRLLEFAKHAGETLLTLSDGLGTDAVQYALHGGDVLVCSPRAERLALAQRHFELRGQTGRFLHAAVSALPLPSVVIDVVLLHGLPGEADAAAVVDEVYRVLKPGGKVLALLPARKDVDYWRRVLTAWRRPVKDGGFTARSLRRLFRRFTEHTVCKRHLRRSEVPHVARWLPLPLLERLAGRLLVLKAFKPVSAALPPAAAA